MQLTLTEELAQFASELSYERLPESAKQYARSLLLDSMACALSSDFADETSGFADFARAAGGAGQSTIVGSQQGTSLLGAVLLNGFQITATTICDTYVPAHVHITPGIIPPALAIAERDGLDGKALLTAIVAGAEVASRLAAGINYGVAGPRGWHMPGILGPFGAAAAVGRLRKLSSAQMRDAFGLSGSQSGGTWASWGTPTVKFHQARGGASGLLAATLAEQGFSTSSDIIGDPQGGLLTAFSDGGNTQAIVDNLGEHFEFEEISLRLWPGGTPLQPSFTALFDLLAKGSVSPEQIADVHVYVAPVVHEAHARFTDPQGTFEALLSYPFVVASALRDRTFWLTSLSEENLASPETRALMSRVSLLADPSLTRESSRVVITMSDGRALTSQADLAKGTRGNPATEEDLRRKYEQSIVGRLPPSQADELLELLARPDHLDRLDRMFELFRSVGERRL